MSGCTFTSHYSSRKKASRRGLSLSLFCVSWCVLWMCVCTNSMDVLRFFTHSGFGLSADGRTGGNLKLCRVGCEMARANGIVFACGLTMQCCYSTNGS